MSEDEATELVRIIRALDKDDNWAVDKQKTCGTLGWKVEVW